MSEHPIVTLVEFSRLAQDIDWVGPPGNTYLDSVSRFEQQRYLLTLARHGGNLPGPSRRPMAFYETLIGVVECQYDNMQHALVKDAVGAERARAEEMLAAHEDFGDPVFNLFYQRMKKIKWEPDTTRGVGKMAFWEQGYAGEIDNLRRIAKANGPFFINYWNRQCDLNNAKGLKIKDCSY